MAARTSNVVEVLKAISTARKGLTANNVFNLVDRFDHPHTVRVVLQQLVKRGLLYNDGRLPCKECGSETLCFRITEAGRIYLERKK